MKLLVADDERRVRDALNLLLKVAADWVNVEDAANVDLLLAQLKRNCPDIVLLDWDMLGIGTVTLIAELHKRCPEVKIVVYTGQAGVKAAALEAGADAFVSKTEHPEKLLAILCSIQNCLEDH